MSQFNENLPPKPVVPYQTNSNINNLFSSKTTMTEEKETPIEKKPLVSPISEKPMTMTKIEPGKKIHLLPTKVDEPEVIQTKSMTQILPRRGRKNAPLRFKVLAQKQKPIETKIEEKIDDDDVEEVKPKKPTINTKAKGNKNLKKQKSERSKLLKKKKKEPKNKFDIDIEAKTKPKIIDEKSTIDKLDLSKTKPVKPIIEPVKPIIEPVKPLITSETPSVISNNPQLMKFMNSKL